MGDALGLVEIRDFIFRDKDALEVAEFLEYVLALRGGNTATVKHVVVMRMFMTTELNRVEKRLVKKLDDAVARRMSNMKNETNMEIQRMASSALIRSNTNTFSSNSTS